MTVCYVLSLTFLYFGCETSEQNVVSLLALLLVMFSRFRLSAVDITVVLETASRSPV
jgi:hypothetical protein